jgi:hypothetical protein
VNHKNIWGDALHRRKFFENYAAESGFNPLIPNNWYSLSFESLKHVKVLFSSLSPLLFFPTFF